MSADEIRDVIARAKARGREITEHDAALFLSARDVLARDSNNEAALVAVENFATFIESGERARSFREFSLPVYEDGAPVAEIADDENRHVAGGAR